MKIKQNNGGLIPLIDFIDSNHLDKFMESDFRSYTQNRTLFFNLQEYIKFKKESKKENFSLSLVKINNILSKQDKKKIENTLFLTLETSIKNRELLHELISQSRIQFKEQYSNEINRFIENEKIKIEEELSLSNNFSEDFYNKIIQEDYSIICQLGNTIDEIFDLVSNSDFLTDFEKNTLFEKNSYLLQNFFKLISLLLYKRDPKFYYYIDIYLNLLQKKINRINNDNLQRNLDLLLFDSESEYFYCQDKQLYEVYFNKLKEILLQYYKCCDLEDQYSNLLENRKKFQKTLLIYKIIEKRIKRECFDDIRKIKKFSMDDALDMLENAVEEMQTKILPISTINMEDIEYLNEKISNFNKKNNISREIQAMLDSLEI